MKGIALSDSEVQRLSHCQKVSQIRDDWDVKSEFLDDHVMSIRMTSYSNLTVYLGMYSKIEKQVCVRCGLFGKDTVIELFLT